jgi:hypothetical protein
MRLKIPEDLSVCTVCGVVVVVEFEERHIAFHLSLGYDVGIKFLGLHLETTDDKPVRAQAGDLR